MKQYIKILRDHNELMCSLRAGGDIADTADALMLSVAMDEVTKAAERYEFVRTLRPYEFQRITDLNLAGKGRFDDLVDEAMKARSASVNDYPEWGGA